MAKQLQRWRWSVLRERVPQHGGTDQPEHDMAGELLASSSLEALEAVAHDQHLGKPWRFCHWRSGGEAKYEVAERLVRVVVVVTDPRRGDA